MIANPQEYTQLVWFEGKILTSATILGWELAPNGVVFPILEGYGRVYAPCLGAHVLYYPNRETKKDLMKHLTEAVQSWVEEERVETNSVPVAVPPVQSELSKEIDEIFHESAIKMAFDKAADATWLAKREKQIKGGKRGTKKA